MNIASPSLDDFLAHGQRFGAELVAETAQQYLRPAEHAYLVCRLHELPMRRDNTGRRIDASVGRRPTPEERKLAEEYAGKDFLLEAAVAA